ncbi:CcdC family protein [Salisediminibacterium halotolerans]|uniref:CcdC family protein n=1 Tax=Salisediminibacterium halotolerans TaxID=517425 RepID=UPI000EABDA37|nr:cytochrome c biogenesis protein CcdC [Salisediminibacterium halotolerans]RLJ74124.1 membrane protein CcdC involved in cytochrome C biogenesis [Actinophytocola xinjiangensis]RPE87783.1 membrane protein CcdC involved in cytochrome C biogenesis [Salisediminibacterium halotolerans]TWG34961.1 membrane protein CcdC involved in cytochrome C biogenesis [Salisediminibacterium halotolerans]GEL07704.1 protein CcdC [Salisediminibacterium halotolerans]
MYGVILSVLAVLMAVLAMFVRMKAMKRPASVKKILLPPAAMSTGFLMFLYPPVREITALQVAEAFTVGLIFSIILIKTSSFEIRDDQIYMKRSKAFPFILIGLLVVRILLRQFFGIYVELEVLSGMFFILAFGMILPWRVAMYVKFKQVQKQHTAPSASWQT